MKRTKKSSNSPQRQPQENTYTKLKEFKPLNKIQTYYMELLEESQVLIATGEPGTGKSLCPVAHALTELLDNNIDTIYITKPVVEVGEESLGYLPGKADEKFAPYMQSILEHFYDLIGTYETTRLLTAKRIQCVPLEFMRGSNFDNCIIIADEMQNATLIQLRTLLTRLKEHTQLIITGDPHQCDLKDTSRSGLGIVSRILHGVRGVAFIEFTEDDIVRSGIVKDIAKAFRKHGY